MAQDLVERFFILTPKLTDKRWQHEDGSPGGLIYQDASGLEMKWSAEFLIPAIGQRVYITMNGIGWAKVQGYFVSETKYGAYVGVMTKATKPPAWLKKQHRRTVEEHMRGVRRQPQWILDGIGCEFGTEIRLHNPKVERAREFRKVVKAARLEAAKLAAAEDSIDRAERYYNVQ